MFKKLTLTALVLIFSGATVAAEEDQYIQIDANQDGTFNKEETSPYSILIDNWSELDANADGIIDQAEFAKFETITLEKSDEREKDAHQK